MFWLIIVPVLAIIMIALVSNFAQKVSRGKTDNKDGGNIYRQTIFREDD